MLGKFTDAAGEIKINHYSPPDCCNSRLPVQTCSNLLIFLIVYYTIRTIRTPKMDSTNSEARDAESVAGAPMDPDRAVSLSGLDVLTMAEFVSVQDRDPSSTSQQPRKSSRRRKCSSPISGHPQSDPQTRHPQNGHPQTVHPQYKLDQRQPALARRDIQLTPLPYKRDKQTQKSHNIRS